ncbi:MAG TPA: hypothetical protein VFR73_20755 [Hyphomicrobiaceae bacterium]|nr:hypothetical protein [Hyphomicrobiaceae bacterium]
MLASRRLPEGSGKSLQGNIDLEQIAALASHPNANGVRVDIEHHLGNVHVVICIVADAASPAAPG